MWMFSGHSTASAGKEQYRPSYLDHFDKQDQEKEKAKNAAANNNSNNQQQSQSPRHNNNQQQSQQQAVHQQQPKQITPPHHFQRPFIDGDFDFVSLLPSFFLYGFYLPITQPDSLRRENAF